MAEPNQTPLKADAPVPDPYGPQAEARATAEGAIDESDDLDDDVAHSQKTASETRRRQSKVGESRINSILPFPFLPNTRPLTVSDIESCLALENAAFSNPQHRCSKEKVSQLA